MYRDERQPSLTSELLTMPDPYLKLQRRPKPTGRPHQGDGAALRPILARTIREKFFASVDFPEAARVLEIGCDQCHLPGTGPLPECR